MYHQIDVSPKRGTPLRGLIVSPGAFSRQMHFLKMLGYQGLSMRHLEPYMNGEKQGRVVGITFDDGYQNNVQNALPVLMKHNFSATCYAVSGMIGGVNSWDQDTGIAQKALMNADDWRRWLDGGMEVGSHTRTHADLATLNPEQARNEIVNSKSELENTLGCEVRHFCYPYGRYTNTTPEIVRSANYCTATTTHRGKIHTDHDPYLLNRIMVARATNLGLFGLKVLSSYEDRRSQ
jgi:peptidoglycan/xylan/chitin deacetylase (PgdA/CDA1 family)